MSHTALEHAVKVIQWLSDYNKQPPEGFHLYGCHTSMKYFDMLKGACGPYTKWQTTELIHNNGEIWILNYSNQYQVISTP